MLCYRKEIEDHIQSPSTNVTYEPQGINHLEYNFAWFDRPAPPLHIFPDNEIENFSQRVKRRVNAKPRRAIVLGTGSSSWTARFAWRSVFRAFAVTASRVIIVLLKPNMKFSITFHSLHSSPNSMPHQVWSTHDSFETFVRFISHEEEEDWSLEICVQDAVLQENGKNGNYNLRSIFSRVFSRKTWIFFFKKIREREREK